MKKFAFIGCLYLIVALGTASAATISYTNGVTNASGASGPSWVSGTSMFLNIISDYGESPLGASGASGSAQSGFDLFDGGGGGLDITLLTWTFGPITLYQGAGTATLAPGAASPGFEDYRYDDNGGVAATNLTFSYDGTVWASGYVTQFIVEVDNNSDTNAVGNGTAYLNTFTASGEAFYNEVLSLTSSSMEIGFVATSFTPVSLTDPGTFSSAGQLNIVTAVPEPSAWAAILGACALGATLYRRRRS